MNRFFRIIIRIFLLLFFGGIGLPDLIFAQDTTCGIIWDAPIVLSDTAYDAYSPKIALTGDDTVHVVWEGGGMRLPYIRSDNAGMSFLPARDLLIDSLNGPGRGHTPFIVTSDLHVYVIFIHAWGIGDSPVTLLLSKNCGVDWNNARYVSPDTQGIIESVAIYGKTLSVIYPTYSAYRHILRSTDGGLIWTNTNEDLDIFAKVALSSNMLHLVQHTVPTRYAEIEYRSSTDLGDTWNQKTILSTIDSFYSDIPSIATDGDSIAQVIWREAKNGCLGMLGCSIAGRTGTMEKDSTQWSSEDILTDYPRGYPGVVRFNATRKAAIWKNEIVPNEIFHIALKINKNNQASEWCSQIDVTPEYNREVGSIDMALSKDAIHVVWDADVTPSSTWRIFYRRGVFITTDVKENNKELPEGFTLIQNYPNPFNPKTKIRFRIQDAGFTSLKVYDVFGREVVILVNEKKQPGEHEVEWNAENFASGVYYYRFTISAVEADRQDSRFKLHTETKKAILMK
jgi:hypothetical protein